MFKTLKPLSSTEHRQLRFDTRLNYQFAAQEMLAPIVLSEAPQVAREYAIVFSDAPGQAPSALLGVHKGVNAHVRPDGRWLGRYVPAHLRRYPFQLAQLPHDVAAPTDSATGERQWLVAMDADAPHLSADTGERLFDDDGQPTPTLQQVNKVLSQLQADVRRTQALSQQIEDAGLLQARTLQVPQAGSQTVHLKGVRVVNVPALAALPGAALEALNKSGALQLVYAQIASMTNLQDGLLTMSAATQPGVQVSENALDFSGIDWSRLQ